MQAARESGFTPGLLHPISEALRTQLGEAAPCSPEQLVELTQALVRFSQAVLGAQVRLAPAPACRAPPQ